MSQDNWTCEFHSYFWHPGDPFQVKFWAEKTTSVLLERTSQWKLTYAGRGQFAPHFYEVALTFEAALPGRNLYSLRLSAETPRSWTKPERQRQDAERAFRHWLRDAQVAAAPDTAGQSEEAYTRLVRIAGEREAQAHPADDEEGIAAVQRAILDALDQGRHFATAHKEGGTTIGKQGRRFVSQEHGESEERREFDTPDEFLKYLRNFYDWESRRDTYPHRPPELDVWRYILARLQ